MPFLVVLQGGRFRRRWDMGMLILVVFSAVFEPFRAAFVPGATQNTWIQDGSSCDCALNTAPVLRCTARAVGESGGFAWTYNELLDAFYWIDLMLAFWTGYIRDGYEEVRSPRCSNVH